MTTPRLPRLLSAAVIAVACSRPDPATATAATLAPTTVERADGSSEASLNASLDSMRRKMTQQEIEAFTDALVRIGSRNSLEVLRANQGDVSAVSRALREHLHGMSVEEILAGGGAP